MIPHEFIVVTDNESNPPRQYNIQKICSLYTYKERYLKCGKNKVMQNFFLVVYISLFEVNDSLVLCRKSFLLASYLKWLSLRSQNPEKCFTLTTQYFQIFMSLLSLFILFLVPFGLLSGHLLGKSCLLGWA